MRALALALLIGTAVPRALAADATPRPSACLLGPDKGTPIKPAAGRVVYCALDLGSKNVKLSVVSMERGKPASIRDERQCKRALGLGAFAYELKAHRAGPIPAASVEQLVETIREFQGLCTLDGGTFVGGAATQWARDATNAADVKKTVLQRTGVEMEILTTAKEAEYGYLAAALGSTGRVVLDPGSNSFEIAWRPKGSRVVSSVTIEYGYVRASAADFECAADYATARQIYTRKVRTLINGELAKLMPPLDLPSLRSLVRTGELDPDVLSFGQDGAVALSVRGLLRDASGKWITDAKAYDAAVAAQVRKPDPRFGLISAEPITLKELGRFIEGVRDGDFKALREDPARDLYGQRALVVPVLAELLLKELGAARLVMLPQEISTGYVLAHLPR